MLPASSVIVRSYFGSSLKLLKLGIMDLPLGGATSGARDDGSRGPFNSVGDLVAVSQASVQTWRAVEALLCGLPVDLQPSGVLPGQPEPFPISFKAEGTKCCQSGVKKEKE